MPENFLIKHISSGKFFHPLGGRENPGNDTSVVLHEGRHSRMHWTFEQIDGHWGYIKHVTSGKIIHPFGGSASPGNDTRLVVHEDRHSRALFALDAPNERIMHKGGKFAHPKGGRPNPDNNTEVVVYTGTHAATRFAFVSTSDPNKEILVYGNPKMVGNWKIIKTVQNPKAEQNLQFEVKIGKSLAESTTHSFQYKWEKTGGITGLPTSVTRSLQYMFEKATSATWSEESTRTTTIPVKPGKTVVTWQYVFEVEQNKTKIIFRSNLFTDTGSKTEAPEDLQYSV